MLDDLRNLFGDMLTGKMKDSEIALTKQESTILRLKIEGFLDETSKLRDERAVLISRLEDQRLQLAEKDSLIADMASKLNKSNHVEERIDQPTRDVLKLLFKVTTGLDFGSIRSHMTMEEGVAMFHLDTLIGLDFIGLRRGKPVLMAMSGDFMPTRIGKDPDLYYIKPKGRAYIMKND